MTIENKYRSFLLLLLSIHVIFSCKAQKENIDQTLYKRYTDKLHEIDGPYIYDLQDSLSVITVEKDPDSTFYIQNLQVKKEAGQTFICNVNNPDQDRFSFTLRDRYKIPPSTYKAPEKILVTSDIEGNFDAFYSMLIGNKVMDEAYNWTFGQGHLVIAGDMVDRGNNAWPCLWLLYKLEQEAEKAGGAVHYILGNHDVMNMHANVRYVRKRYLELAKILSGKSDEKEAYLFLLSNTNELAKWIATKNTVEKIGENLYVHGGISADVVDADLSIETMNTLVRKNIRKNLTHEPGEDEQANLLFSRQGPLWYRGLAIDYKEHYKKIDVESLDQILAFYKAERMIIGHTIVDTEITSDFGGKVIRVDIKHPEQKFNGITQGLLIEDGTYFKVNEQGEKFHLNLE